MTPLSFISDREKMLDFFMLSKEEFLLSYSYLSEEEYDATLEDVKHYRNGVNKMKSYNIEVDYKDLTSDSFHYTDDIKADFEFDEIIEDENVESAKLIETETDGGMIVNEKLLRSFPYPVRKYVAITADSDGKIHIFRKQLELDHEDTVYEELTKYINDRKLNVLSIYCADNIVEDIDLI